MRSLQISMYCNSQRMRMCAGLVASTMTTMAMLAGCVSDDPAAGDADRGDDRTGQTEQAFSANWFYSWGDTKYSFTNIGTTTDRTCFLSGMAGNLTPSGATGSTGVGVRVNTGGDHELYVASDGGELSAFARCVNSAAGRTREISWRSNQSAQVLGPVTPNRRCFLTQLYITNAYPALGGHGFKSNADYTRVWQDGINWYIGGVQSGVVWAAARCIDVNSDDGSWMWFSGDPGSRQDALAYNPGGVTCLLTGIGGHFDHDDWADGAYISYQAGINQFFMNTSNGHSGWASCIE